MRSPLLFALGLAVFAGAVISACAKGSDGFASDTEEGDSSSADSSSSSSSSGAGGKASGSSSGAGGAGGAGGASSSSSGGSGGSCPESPCKLSAPQCGCGVDEQCSLDGKLAIACVPAGSVMAGQPCDVVNKCGPATICVTPGGANVSVCEKFCDDDSQCQAPGGLCVLKLNDGMGGTLAGVTLCSENCDPTNPLTCPVAGTGCHPAQEAAGQMRFFTTCGGAGAGAQGASCVDNGDCAAGSGCFNTGGPSLICLQYCKVNAPVCPGATQCVPIQVNMVDIVVGNDQYGACL